MNDIVLTPDGNSIWVDPYQKLAKVKMAIEPYLQRIKDKWDSNENSQYPRRLNFSSIILSRLTLAFRKFPLVPSKYAIDIDAETLRQYANCFFDLIEFIMSFYDEFICTKNMFCQFMGIESFVYNQWLISGNPNIFAEIQFVEGFLIDSTMIQAQTGKVREKSTEVRLRSSDFGHNLNVKPTIDEKPQINLVAYDLESVQRAISGFGLNTKKIGNKKE